MIFFSQGSGHLSLEKKSSEKVCKNERQTLRENRRKERCVPPSLTLGEDRFKELSLKRLLLVMAGNR
ncbi:hypothetical protein GOP47_0015415 [Adiantum capillus-veneris]|uniref:Uncharacterized protein n=1 Tax=Adiantum capillus-veneris TaxID=13818 RepID=A0A9D4ZBM7_ADICA|nr:hypothetical protein GOP47_0015415 [Adiantum capillus-veneris]